MTSEKTRNTILDAFMALVAERPWNDVTMVGVAEKAGIKPSALRKVYDSRSAVLGDVYRRIDVEVLDGTDPELSDEPAVDRLFDVLMRRLDTLEPNKAAIRALGKAALGDPVLAAQLNRMSLTSQRWMLTAAGIEVEGMRGFAMTQALVIAYLRVLRVWMRDKDPGKARTMAALDRELKRGATTMERLDKAERYFAPFKRAFTERRTRGRRPRTPDAGGPDVGEAPSSPSA